MPSYLGLSKVREEGCFFTLDELSPIMKTEMYIQERRFRFKRVHKAEQKVIIK